MRKITHPIAEAGRLKSQSTFMDGNNGAFVFQGPCGAELFVIASDGLGWDHVSISIKNRNPNWQEMCFVKNLFWDEEELVIQYHPPQSKYKNFHPHCLHLWKPQGVDIPLPEDILV